MTNPLFSKFTSIKQVVPEIEEIEGLLRTYRPTPGGRLPDKVASATWMIPTNTLNHSKNRFSLPVVNQKKTTRWALAFLSVLIVVLLLTLTNIGQSLAESISRFFKVSTVNYLTEVVSTTPRPTSSSNYPYDQYTLSIDQAEAQAGFEIKSISTLPSKDWVFHGAKVQSEIQGVSLFYSLPYKDNKPNHEAIYLYISEHKNEFDDSQWWGQCPKSAITDLKINNWSAQLADGTMWQTETEPTPGATFQWICRVVDRGTVMTLRWEETDLKYEISVTNAGYFGEGADMTIPWLNQQDLINLAENLK